MITNEQNDPKNTSILYELDEYFNFLIKSYKLKKFPKVLMLSGEKGLGKFTLFNHFLHFIYDEKNYSLKDKTFNNQSSFHKQLVNNTCFNVIYLSGDNFKNVKIDDIRNLKSTIYKSSISSKERYIILDDIELFNLNSLNALLKIVEEPGSNDFFVLINNKTRPLVNTIYSRSVELKIIVANDERIRVIKSLIDKLNLEVLIDYESLYITPGNFLQFNTISKDNKIGIDGDYLENLKSLLNIYKKTKNLNLINFILFITDNYFMKLKQTNENKLDKIIKNKLFISENIDKFLRYNLNQTSLLNSIKEELTNG